jgi:glycosyltransferase involved in cell wall biosynthesis
MTKICTAYSPLLSIITVCLNEPKLEYTCESIINQSFQNFEWIVIDGGSDDKTLAIFEKYKNRMDYFASEPDGGIYFGMNKGLQQATGMCLNFMNAGDRFFNEYTLENIYSNLEKDNAYDIIVGICKFDNQVHERLQFLYPPKSLDIYYLYAHTIPHQAAFIKRDLFTNLGGYDTKFHIAADYKQWISFCRHGYKFKFINDIISVNDNSGISCSPQWRKKQIDELAEIRKKYFTQEEAKEGMKIMQKNFKKVADYVRKRN